MAMPDLQRFPSINNVEDIVVFLGSKVLSSDYEILMRFPAVEMHKSLCCETSIEKKSF